MKRQILNLIAICCLASLVAACSPEHKDNPRGVYKLVSIVGKDKKEVPATFEQYKICTDSVTWTLAFHDDNHFTFKDNDNCTFDYTGEAPDAQNPHQTRVFDSDANGFRLKWWSEYKDHELYPTDDWCTEIYQSGQLTPTASHVIDAFTKPLATSPDQPLLGQWYNVGRESEEALMNGSLGRIESRGYKSFFDFMALTEQHSVRQSWGKGKCRPVRYISAEEFEFLDTHQTGHLLPGNPDILVIMPEKKLQNTTGQTAKATPTVWVRNKTAATMAESVHKMKQFKMELSNRFKGHSLAQ